MLPLDELLQMLFRLLALPAWRASRSWECPSSVCTRPRWSAMTSTRSCVVLQVQARLPQGSLGCAQLGIEGFVLLHWRKAGRKRSQLSIGVCHSCGHAWCP